MSSDAAAVARLADEGDFDRGGGVSRRVWSTGNDEEGGGTSSSGGSGGDRNPSKRVFKISVLVCAAAGATIGCAVRDPTDDGDAGKVALAIGGGALLGATAPMMVVAETFLPAVAWPVSALAWGNLVTFRHLQ